jgi:hypothetical protein
MDGSLGSLWPLLERRFGEPGLNQLQVELFGFPIICRVYLYLRYGICTFAFFLCTLALSYINKGGVSHCGLAIYIKKVDP